MPKDDIFDNKTVSDKPKFEIKEDGSIVIGEKQFENVEAVVNSKIHADEFIETLKTEKQVVSDDLVRERDQNELMKQFNQKLDMLNGSSTSSNDFFQDGTEGEGGNKVQQPTSIQDLDEVVKRQVAEQVDSLRADLKATDNKKKFRELLGSVDGYGSDAKGREAWQNYLESPAYDPEVVALSLKRNPNALLGLVKQVTQATPTNKKTNIRNPSLPAGGNTINTGSTPTGSDNDFKANYNKFKKSPNQWSLDDQLAMNESYDQVVEETGSDEAFFASSKDRILKQE